MVSTKKYVHMVEKKLSDNDNPQDKLYFMISIEFYETSHHRNCQCRSQNFSQSKKFSSLTKKNGVVSSFSCEISRSQKRKMYDSDLLMRTKISVKYFVIASNGKWLLYYFLTLLNTFYQSHNVSNYFLILK